jgi:BolA family transcriptional regulator, general stress-responsive regulator
MGVIDEIRESLEAKFTPRELEVVDESEAHRGHSGWREGGETHFHVTIRAGAFAGMSRLARHRAVHAALGPDLVGRIHALGLTVSD